MLWEQVKDRLKSKVSPTSHSLWIEPITYVRTEGHVIELACPDRFFCSWVMENYLAAIREGLAESSSGEYQVRFVVSKVDQLKLLPEVQEQLRLPSIPRAGSFIRNLHPRYTFDEFMVGESNFLAQSACKALAKNDYSFGPYLYIHAGTGLGKSHLTHAVAHNIINNAPGTRLHYLTAQQFSAEMVQKIKTNTMGEFKSKYLNQCDMLLIEDVHTLAGKVKTQEELNEVLDCLMKSGKRIILTGAVAPRSIKGIDDGIRSRMSAGLISTIISPDFETRALITKRKAENNNIFLSDSLIQYIAQNVKGDIRMLESAIVGLKAKTSLLKTEPDLGMVKEIIGEIIGRNRELSAEIIRDFVAGQFKVPVEDIRSKCRKKSVAFPRQVSIYLARNLTEQGLAEIGKAFNRDHSTVLHSVRVITQAMARNSSIRGQVDLLKQKLKE